MTSQRRKESPLGYDVVIAENGIIDSFRSQQNHFDDLRGSPVPLLLNQDLQDSQSEPVCESVPYPIYEPGRYEAQCTFARTYRDPQFRCFKVLLRFKLVPDGEEVCGFLNLGQGPKPKAGRRSKYWRAWVIANDGPPQRRQVLSPRVFIGKIFQVEIEYVQRSYDGRDHPVPARYSTVREIISRIYP